MEQKSSVSDNRRKAFVIVLLVLIVSFLHYGTQTSLPLLHDFYRRLYYIPVGLAAVWFGVRGGLRTSLLVAALYLPHIIIDWHHMERELANQFMEIALYFAFSGLIGHFADQERRFRQHLEETAEKLERSYQDLRKQADQIIEIEGQLRRADRLSAIGQLSAALTHEIRNPLGSIKGTAEILRDDFPPGHPKAEFLNILLKETDRLNQVVEDFLRYARPQQGGEGMELIDLSKLAEETVVLLTAQAKKGGVSLQSALAAELPVWGSPVQLKQVLLNLLLNAIQATPSGGSVRVASKVQEGRVKGLEYRDVEGKLAALVVEDEGPGIPETVLPRVFEPFYTTKSEGTGLGLAISLRIAEAHGGNLTAENRLEGGARFTLSLPLADEAPTPRGENG
jgi:signal transduction histidine kinase